MSTEAITLTTDLFKKVAKVNPDVAVAVVAKQELIYGLARISQTQGAVNGIVRDIL